MIKRSMCLISFLQCFFHSNAESSLSLTLRDIQYRESGVISLEFSKTLPANSVDVSYVNDFIQIEFSKAIIPKARVLKIESTPVKKIWVYQFSPGILRARIFLDQKAEAFKKKLNLEIAQNRMEVSLPHHSVETAESTSQSESMSIEKEAEPLISDAPKITEEEIPLEGSFLEKSDPTKAKAEAEDLPPSQKGESSSPSLKSMLEKLAWIVLGFVFLNACIHIVRRLMKKKTAAEGGFLKNMGRFAKRNLGIKDGMIEIISTHYLDPKNKIAVVKVGGRLLVLGITQDSMSLITQIEHPTQKLEEQVEDEIISETALASSQNFSALFEKEKVKDSEPISARSRIKSRLEGLKPL